MGEVILLASFSQSIPIKYGVKSYQDTKNTYDWIMKSLDKGKFQDLKVETSFQFDISEISCSCANIEEFVDLAYGQSNYKFITMNFRIESKGGPLWFISVDTICQVRISAENKSLLEKVVGLLKNTSLNETEVNDPISVTYVEHQESNITFNGNNNVVANNSSTITASEKNTETKVSQWFSAIGQNLLANGIWYLLCLAAGAIAAVILTKR